MGAVLFGLVVGWITYYTLAHVEKHGVADIAAVIAAVGGAAVLALFPAQSQLFDDYAIGLAIGFFAYGLLVILVPFFAFGRKEGWRLVWTTWASHAVIMMARVDNDDVGPEPLAPNPGGR
jgi:hypothetical protein